MSYVHTYKLRHDKFLLLASHVSLGQVQRVNAGQSQYTHLSVRNKSSNLIVPSRPPKSLLSWSRWKVSSCFNHQSLRGGEIVTAKKQTWPKVACGKFQRFQRDAKLVVNTCRMSCLSGANDLGQLGTGDTEPRSTPSKIGPWDWTDWAPGILGTGVFLLSNFDKLCRIL